MKDRTEQTIELNTQFATMRPVRDSLPLHLVNGAVFSNITIACKNCHNQVPQFDTKGVVRPAIANSYVIDGLAYCEYCNLLTPFNCHVIPESNGFAMVVQHRHPFDDKGTVLKFERKP